MVITIQIWFGLTRFGKDFFVCSVMRFEIFFSKYYEIKAKSDCINHFPWNIGKYNGKINENIMENGEYNTNLVWINEIRKRFLRVHGSLNNHAFKKRSDLYMHDTKKLQI